MAFDFHGDLTGWDLEGFHQGGDTELWKRLGAHEVTIHDDERGEIKGTRFSVWSGAAAVAEQLGEPLRPLPGLSA